MAKKAHEDDEKLKKSDDSSSKHIKLSDVDEKLKKKKDAKKGDHQKSAQNKKSDESKPDESKDDDSGSEASIDIDIDVSIHIKRFKLLRAIILVSVLLLGLSVVLYLLGPGSSEDRSKGDDAIEEVLPIGDASRSLLESRLGFAVSYDDNLLSVSATAVDEDGNQSEADGDSLADWGDYDSATFVHKSDLAYEAVSDSFGIAELTIRTSPDEVADADASARSLISPSVGEGEEATELDSSVVSVNGIDYTKTSYEIESKYGITDLREDIYSTVQNDTPYAFSLRYSSFVDDGRLRDLETVVSSVEYSPPIRDSVGLGDVNISRTTPNAISTNPFLSQVQQSLPDDAVKTDGGSLKRSTVLNVVARNAIATVRIATNDCRDFELLLPGGSVGLAINDACAAGVGSGSIVTDDGYISTNGHVVVFGDPVALQIYLSLASITQLEAYVDYLEDVGILFPGQGDLLLSDVLSGSERAASALLSSPALIPVEYVKLVDSSPEYAVQLSDEPIEAEIESLPFSLKYTDTVIPATLIDYDFDPSGGLSGVDLSSQNSSDVALLKADLSNAPTVQLGSIDNVDEGDLLTAIGFPAFVDGGIATTESRTVASATQGEVLEITFDNLQQAERKLITTDVPVAGGNSGGPSFDSDGSVVGLVTYKQGSTCADDQCFGQLGVMRDIADFKKLLDNESVTVDASEDAATQKWQEVLDNYSIGYFKTAASQIDEFEELYDKSYLSGSFKSVAEQKVANGESLEPGLPFKAIAIGAGVTFPLIIVITTIAIYAHRRKGAQVGLAYPVNPFSANVQYQAAPAQQPAPMPQQINYNPYPNNMQQSSVSPVAHKPLSEEPATLQPPQPGQPAQPQQPQQQPQQPQQGQQPPTPPQQPQ